MHYTGASMLGVFTPGDDIAAEPVSFDSVEAGDVILFADPAAPKKRLVHRVIAATPEGLHTQGDNNARPDPSILPPGTPLLLAVARRNGSGEFPITRGDAGWREFKRNRRRVRRRMLLRRLLRVPANLAVLRLLAPPPDKLEKRQFRRDGELFKSLLYRGDSPVASYDFGSGRWVVLGKWKLFYTPRALAAITP